MIALADQIKFVEAEIATREEAYPVRVQMKRMTQKEADRTLGKFRAVLETLKQSDVKAVAAAALDVPEAALTDLTTGGDDRYAKIFPTLEHVRKCAHQRRELCQGCQAIDDVLEEAMELV